MIGTFDLTKVPIIFDNEFNSYDNWFELHIAELLLNIYKITTDKKKENLHKLVKNIECCYRLLLQPIGSALKESYTLAFPLLEKLQIISNILVII